MVVNHRSREVTTRDHDRQLPTHSFYRYYLLLLHLLTLILANCGKYPYIYLSIWSLISQTYFQLYLQP